MTIDDCISRQAVLDTEYQIKEINGVEYVMLSEVQMKIRKMPSYDLEEYSTKLWKLAYERGKAEQKWINFADDLTPIIDMAESEDK